MCSCKMEQASIMGQEKVDRLDFPGFNGHLIGGRSNKGVAHGQSAQIEGISVKKMVSGTIV